MWLLSAGYLLRQESGVRCVRKQGYCEVPRKMPRRKNRHKKSKVPVLRVRGRKPLQSEFSGKCSQRACPWPVVRDGLCVHHLRDLFEDRSY